MLSRRYLRIKAMQNLYAYTLAQRSNLGEAMETIAALENLSDDERKALKKHFATLVKQQEPKISATDDILRDVYAKFAAANKKDEQRIRKQMLSNAEGIYGIYYSILHLLGSFIDAEERILSRKEEKSRLGNNAKVVWKRILKENMVLKALTENGVYQSEVIRRDLDGKSTAGQALTWFKDYIMDDLEYNSMLDKEANFKNDQQLVRHIVKNIIFKNEVIDKFFEEEYLYWSEDKPIVKSMVDKTIKSMEIEKDGVEMATLSYNWEEDKRFFYEIFDKSTEKEKQLDEFIAVKSKNWEIDRLALIDNIILRMSLAEMMYFSSIPVKVTINEYIDISKRYSTPKSRHFINGILDVLSKELKEKGLLKKSGRGLLDNK
jgi:N utilization substance protein B